MPQELQARRSTGEYSLGLYAPQPRRALHDPEQTVEIPRVASLSLSWDLYVASKRS